MTRVLWLAVAEGRGHLMRAELVRRLLAPHGVDVEIVTTAADGVAYLRTFGTEAQLLSDRFRLVYDDEQDLRVLRTAAGMAGYLARPGRARRDRRELERMAAGADLVVNDSFHPALFGADLPVAYVHAVHTREVLLHKLGARLFQAIVGRALGRAVGCLEYTLAPTEPNHVLPIVPLPAAPPVMRAPGSRRRAVVYLNPYFRSPALAEAIERGLDGFDVHLVGEGYEGRPGWHARDAHLCDAIAGADLLVSTPSIGMATQARLCGLPFIALLTRQPEQQRNSACLGGSHVVVDVNRDDLPVTIALAAARLAENENAAAAPRDPRAEVAAVHDTWRQHLLRLIARARSRPRPRRGVALVLETENVRGDPDAMPRLERLVETLARQTRPLASLDEVVITGALSVRDRRRLRRAAPGAHLRFVDPGPDAGYYGAKNAGLHATRSEIVVFGDSDCAPAPGWLEALLHPFDDPSVQVVAGRTSYGLAPDRWVTRAADALDFPCYPAADAQHTANFYANNVAFRRDVLGAGFPPHHARRGSCGLLAMDLRRRGVPIVIAEHAQTHHPLPAGRALVKMRLSRGRDIAAMAPHLGETHLPVRWRWVARAPRLMSALVVAVRVRQGVRILRGRRLGSLLALSALDLAGALSNPVVRDEPDQS